MKACILTAIGLGVSAVDINTEEVALPVRLMQQIHDPKYHALSANEKIISQTPELWDVAPCQYWWNDSWYNLISTDGFDSTSMFSATNADAKVYFTMCQLIKNADSAICPAGGNDAYAAQDAADGNCTPLSGSDLSTSVEDNSFRISSDNETLGMKYSGGGNNCTLEVGLICDQNMASGLYETSALVNLDGACEFQTTMTSKMNCPVYSLNSLWAWLNKYYWLWGAILIVMGFFLGMFGQKLFSATLFIIGTLVTVSLIWLLFYSTFLSDSTEGWVGWVVLVCSILLGLVGGYVLYKCQRLGATIIGAWGGFLLGIVFNTTVLWAASSEVAFWIISISFALIAAALAFVFYYHAVILSTSFVGSYFFVRGISLYAGGFPNEWALIEQIKSGAIDHISYWFYLYLFFIIVASVLCTCFQYKHFKKGVEDGDYDANGHPKHPYDTGTEERKCC